MKNLIDHKNRRAPFFTEPSDDAAEVFIIPCLTLQVIQRLHLDTAPVRSGSLRRKDAYG